MHCRINSLIFSFHCYL